MLIKHTLFKRLFEEGITDKFVFVGGVIPGQDVPRLKEIGVAGVFPGGTPLIETIEFLKKTVNKA